MTQARSFLTQAGVALEVGAELITDGDMEAVGIANWTAEGSSTVTKQAAAAKNGTQGLRIVGVSGAESRAKQALVVTALTRYRASGWIRSNQGTKTASVAIYDNTNAGLIVSSVRATLGVTYVPFTCDFTTPASCISIDVRLNCGAEANTDSVYFDDVSVRKLDYGTAVTPSLGIAVNEIGVSPRYEVIPDNGFRGLSAVDFKSLQGVGDVELTLSGLAYPEEIGYFIRALFGASAVASGDAYTHSFYLSPFTESLTLEADLISGSNGANRLVGCVLSNLTFEFNGPAGALAYTAQGEAKQASKVTATNPARTDNNPWQGWRGTVTSTGYAAKVVDGSIVLDRPIAGHHVMNNTQYRSGNARGPLAVTGQLTCIFEDQTFFDNFLAHLNQSFVISFSVGSGATEKTFTFTASSLGLADDVFEIDRSGEGIVVNVPIRALYNSTDVGPAAITLVNARSSYAA